MKESNGQISAEYLFLFGVLIIVIFLAFVFVAGENELNMAMIAARSGVIEGMSSSSAIYPTDSYNDESKHNVVHPYSVDIVNISYSELGVDNNYGKKKIQFRIYTKANEDYSKKELDAIGDRINYNLRKALAISFNTTPATNKLYNPVFSSHYVFTTANIKWV